MRRIIDELQWQLSWPLGKGVLDGLIAFSAFVVGVISANALRRASESGTTTYGVVHWQIFAFGAVIGAVVATITIWESSHIDECLYLVFSPARAVWYTTALVVIPTTLFWLAVEAHYGSYRFADWLAIAALFGPILASTGYRCLAYVDGFGIAKLLRQGKQDEAMLVFNATLAAHGVDACLVPIKEDNTHTGPE